MRLLTHLLFFAALLASCTHGSDNAANSDLDMHMVWLGAEGDGPPNDVATVTVQRLDALGEAVAGASADYTLARLEDLDGDGRPELEQVQLPTNEAFSLHITARDDEGRPIYEGRIGPLTLAPGERRYAPVYLYTKNTPSVVADLEYDFGILPTATSLPDGRILVAGGFNSVEAADCPSGSREASVCVIATSSTTAHVFDPATAQFYEIDSGMLASRGGHSATSLPDGRVLIAGGAEAAYITFEATNDESAPRRSFGFFPLPSPESEGYEDALSEARLGVLTYGGHASFEIFDPRLNPEPEDVDRNGDPARGGFVGGPDGESAPGPLNTARCLHAATGVLTSEGAITAQVLLAGGLHGDSTQSWEIFDDRRPGGSGVYDNRGSLLKSARQLPSAAALPGLAGSPILIAGGGSAASSRDLAELWYPLADNPNGQTIEATEVEGSLFTAHDTTTMGASMALLRPTILTFGDNSSEVARKANVLGWYGPLCSVPDGSVSTMASYDDGSALQLCSHGVRSAMGYQLSEDTLMSSDIPATGATTASSFSASATLGNGRRIVIGGITSLNFDPVNSGAIFSVTGAIGGAPSSNFGARRFMHAAAPFHNSGVLVVGGIGATSPVLRLAGGAHAAQL